MHCSRFLKCLSSITFFFRSVHQLLHCYVAHLVAGNAKIERISLRKLKIISSERFPTLVSSPFPSIACDVIYGNPLLELKIFLGVFFLFTDAQVSYSETQTKLNLCNPRIIVYKYSSATRILIVSLFNVSRKFRCSSAPASFSTRVCV